jgi:hypothetical protein
MRRSLALAVVLALSLAACSRSLFPPPQPAVITSLVDAAPTGSTVSVEHWDKDPWGNFDAHWSVDVTGVPVGVAYDAYLAWCDASPSDCSDVLFWPLADEETFNITLYDSSPLAR